MGHTEVPDGFVARKRLRVGRESSVQLAERKSDGRTVVLKTFAKEVSGHVRARREFDVLERVAHPRVVRALELIEDLDDPVLVLEYIPGITVSQWVHRARPDLRSALRVAVQLGEILCHVHERRFVHRDITPRNVMVEPSTLDTHLIDFGLARPLGAAEKTAKHALSAGSGPVGTLEYIAPEQTGRMNRGWDFRSDLYTFGATLYYVLTGQPPFEAGDQLELIHAHIARMPRDPRELRTEIPLPLARIVLRLLQKEPEERYASVLLLHADLTALRDELESTGTISDDTVLRGLRVSSDRLGFGKKLYGRDSEQARLESLFARVAAGESQTVLVSGGPGAGKSALVDALRRSISASSGYLVSGKFDPYRARPYSAWIAALESLTHQLLLLSDTHLDRIRAELRAGLGNVAQAMVDLVPDLSFIVGEVPPVPRLGPRETQERLALALARAVRVLARPEHPLVVLLDDLHAGDEGSLFLTESLLCSDEPPGALLLIGTYRTDDVGPEHPLALWIEQLTKRGVSLESLEVADLDGESVVELLCDVLGREAEEVRALARQIELKTGNSPFLIREFLENLHARGLLRFTGEGWTWDAEEVRAAAVPEGAVQLMLARIERLDSKVASVLRFASCVGDEFDLAILVDLGCGQHSEVEQGLFALSDAGLIVPARGGFRFAHDRIREAAQALLSSEEREQLHYETGRFLLSQTPEEQLAERAFLLAEHLNQGRRRVPEELRIALIRINLLAGQCSLSLGAVEAASDYLSIGRELLREQDWTSDRTLSLSLHLSGADAEFQCARYDRSLERLDALDARNLALMEKVQVWAKRILIFALTRSPEEATSYAIWALRETGVRWRVHPSTFQTRIGLWRGRRALQRSHFGLDWKPATQVDPRWLASLVLSGASGGIASRTDARLSALIAYRAVRTYTRYGYVGNAGFALAACALAEITVGGDPKVALSLAEAALTWKERNSDPIYDLRVDFVVHGLVYPWLMRRRKALAPLARVAKQAQEIGDHEFAYYAGINQSIYLALGGEEIGATDQRLRELADGVLRGGHRYPEAVPCHRIHSLLLVEEDIDAQVEARVRELEPTVAAMPASGAVYFRTLCLQVLCVYGRYDLAFEQSERMQADLFRVVPFLHVADHTFYRGLAAAALASQTSGRARRGYVAAFERSAHLVQRWGGWGPDFVHMATFLQAERAKLRGRLQPARLLYDRAASSAQQQGFVHHAALAHERKGDLLARQGRDTESAVARREAKSLYGRWGCPGKAEQLRG